MYRLAPKARTSGFCVYYKGDMEDSPKYGPTRVNASASLNGCVVPQERFKEERQRLKAEQEAHKEDFEESKHDKIHENSGNMQLSEGPKNQDCNEDPGNQDKACKQNELPGTRGGSRNEMLMFCMSPLWTGVNSSSS